MPAVDQPGECIVVIRREGPSMAGHHTVRRSDPFGVFDRLPDLRDDSVRAIVFAGVRVHDNLVFQRGRHPLLNARDDRTVTIGSDLGPA
jgi:hypothetical protein